MSVRLSTGQLYLSVVPIRYLHAGLSIDLPAYIFVRLPACCSVCPSIHQPVIPACCTYHLATFLLAFISLPGGLSVCLSTCLLYLGTPNDIHAGLSVCFLSVCLVCTYLRVCLSISVCPPACPIV